METEFLFKQGQFLYSSVLLKGSFRFSASNSESAEQENASYIQSYKSHIDKLVEKYKKVLVLNLLNVDHAIERSEIDILECIIQQSPSKSVKYKYKNLVPAGNTIVEACFELISELEKIYEIFGFSQCDCSSENVLKVQTGAIRVNCYDSGDISDIFTLFHFLAVFKQLFYEESTASFSAFARGFTIASTMNVMGIRNMLMNTFKRTNPLLNYIESEAASALSSEIPLEFDVVRQNSNKIRSRVF